MNSPSSSLPKKRSRECPDSSDSHISSTSLLDFLSASIDSDIFQPDFKNNKSSQEKLFDERHCNCKRSKCLKLYCECFAKNTLCNPTCKCVDCSNCSGNEERIQKSKTFITRRNPAAFKQKIIHGNRHSRGCKCKSSKCKKKYCECYAAGVDCTQYCECTDCCNGKNGSFYSVAATIFNNTFENSEFLHS